VRIAGFDLELNRSLGSEPEAVPLVEQPVVHFHAEGPGPDAGLGAGLGALGSELGMGAEPEVGPCFGWSRQLGSKPKVVPALEPPAVRRHAEVPGSVPLVLPRLEWSVRAGRAEGSGKGRCSVQGRQSTVSHA